MTDQKPAPYTEAELEEFEYHAADLCSCDDRWPCQYARFLATIDALKERVTEAHDHIAELNGILRGTPTVQDVEAAWRDGALRGGLNR